LIYRARYVLTMDGPPLEGGCVRVEGDRIAQVGALDDMDLRRDTVRDIPDAVLIPGLINAHCHLELGMARGLLPRGEAFPMWVSRLRKSLEGSAPEAYSQAVRLGALECLKHGTTTIVDVGNTGAALAELASLPLRSYPYIEVIGLDPASAAARLADAEARLAAAPAASGRYLPGITCHAPYSCSPELMRAVAGRATRRGPYTLHVAESAEETSLFREGKGSLYEFCRRIYPALPPASGESPIGFLGRRGLIPRGSLFAHCNHADAEDIGILSATVTSVVHCPRSRDFFGHGGFPFRAYRDAGVNVCLGTDSLASNEGLSLFDEMAEFRRGHPDVPGRDILAMATVNAALALGRAGDLGRLVAGAKADLIAVAMRHHPERDIHEELVSEARDVLLAVVDGEEVFA
jgi:cytosine/adenosine deaminase-related metal-dependent hydrolase